MPFLYQVIFRTFSLFLLNELKNLFQLVLFVLKIKYPPVLIQRKIFFIFFIAFKEKPSLNYYFADRIEKY